MGWIYNLKNAFKIGFSDATTHSVLGLNKKYSIDQSNHDYPFEQGYAKSSDVYAIVNKIVGNAKNIPWLLKKRTGEDVELIENGALFDLIKNPNPEQSRVQYVEAGLIQYLLGGNVFFNSVVPIGFGVPSETYLLHPQNMDIKTMQEGKHIKPLRYVYKLGNKEFKIDPEEITHLKYCNPTEYGIQSLFGLSPLVAGYLTLTGLNNNQTANAAILEHQGAAGILSNESEIVLTPDQQKEQQKLFDKKHSGATLFGQIIQSMAKVKYTKLGLDPSQLKIIESKLLMMRDLCNIYDVRSMLFNDPQGSTFNNVAAAEKQLWTGPIKSNLDSFINSYELEVVDKFNQREFPNGQSEYFIDADYSGVDILQEDELRRANKAKAMSEVIVKIMTSTMTEGQKVQALVFSAGLTENEAQILVTGTTI